MRREKDGNISGGHLNQMHAAHCTLHTAHGTRHTAHCTLHTAHCWCVCVRGSSSGEEGVPPAIRLSIVSTLTRRYQTGRLIAARLQTRPTQAKLHLTPRGRDISSEHSVKSVSCTGIRNLAVYSSLTQHS